MHIEKRAPKILNCPASAPPYDRQKIASFSKEVNEKPRQKSTTAFFLQIPVCYKLVTWKLLKTLQESRDEPERKAVNNMKESCGKPGRKAVENLE